MLLKASFSILLISLSQLSFAAGDKDKIVPANKENISREVGGSVYFECKKLGPFSTDCNVNCGNGNRFRKSSGYCFYLSKGIYTLSVSMRHRNKDLLHTATVTISEKSSHSAATRNFNASQAQFFSTSAGHVPSSSPPTSIPPLSPGLSNPFDGSSSMNNQQFTNNQAVQDTFSNGVGTQAQQQLSVSVSEESQNANILSDQNSFESSVIDNNSIDQSSQLNNVNNNAAGNASNNAIQNSN